MHWETETFIWPALSWWSGTKPEISPRCAWTFFFPPGILSLLFALSLLLPLSLSIHILCRLLTPLVSQAILNSSLLFFFLSLFPPMLLLSSLFLSFSLPIPFPHLHPFSLSPYPMFPVSLFPSLSLVFRHSPPTSSSHVPHLLLFVKPGSVLGGRRITHIRGLNQIRLRLNYTNKPIKCHSKSNFCSIPHIYCKSCFSNMVLSPVPSPAPLFPPLSLLALSFSSTLSLFLIPSPTKRACSSPSPTHPTAQPASPAWDSNHISGCWSGGKSTNVGVGKLDFWLLALPLTGCTFPRKSWGLSEVICQLKALSHMISKVISSSCGLQFCDQIGSLGPDRIGFESQLCTY